LVISLRCKYCKNSLIASISEYLFLCSNCKKLFLLTDTKLKETESFLIKNDCGFTLLLPLMLFKSKIEYLHFASNRQREIASRCGINPIIAVRAFSMIDPLYFGDIEFDITQKLNNSRIEIIPFAPQKKNFIMNIKPEITERLSRYTFMKYFDRNVDITGMQYSFTVESLSILFLKGIRKNNKIYLPDLSQELPESAIFSILSET